MANFSRDEDLLKREPVLFDTYYPRGQILTQGSDGSISVSGSTVELTATGGDFLNSGVTSGHVVWLGKSSGSTVYWDEAFAIGSVCSSTAVHIEAKAGRSRTCSSVTYRIATYDNQHEMAHFELCQAFNIDDGDLDTDNDEADLYNSRQLREASATRALELIYRGMQDTVDDYFAKKAELYSMEAARTKQSVNLQFDTDADNDPDRTERRGSVRLIVNRSGDAWPAADFPETAEDAS
jgi:hypothetical protein